MIIVKLIGGLGNQLFQYAVGRALALRTQQSLGLDLSWFKLQELRRYRLDHFNISYEIVPPELADRLTGSQVSYLPSQVIRYFRRMIPFYEPRYFLERPRQFNPEILKISAEAYLEGYWQSENYFVDFEDIIRKDLTFKHGPDPENQKLLKKITKVNSISVHVRRGDYITDQAVANNFATCPLAYYQQAIKQIVQVESSPHFFIFSDDISWARKNLAIDFPITFLEHNGTEKDYEDLRLMSHCRHHVIANSSFSWWGAWLAPYPDKVVVAPQKWFQDNSIDTSYLVPDRWMRL